MRSSFFGTNLREQRQALGAAINTDRGNPTITVGSSGMGQTQYKKRAIVGVTVPFSDRAEDRVIQFHELLHAAAQPLDFNTKEARTPRMKRITELNKQLALDAWLHTGLIKGTPVSEQIARDCLTAALTEARMMRDVRRAHKDNPQAWDFCVAHLLRALSVGSVLHQCGVGKGAKTIRGKHVVAPGGMSHCPFVQIHELAEKTVGANVTAILLSIVKDLASLSAKQLMTRGGWELYVSCCERLQSLMSDGEGEGEEHDRPTDHEPTPEKPQASDKSRPLSEMHILNLPLVSRTVDSVGEVRDDTSGEFQIGEYVDFLATGEFRELFLREEEIEPQGTILLDGSGSMGVSTERLTQLCKRIPGATIAVYSGDGKCHQLYHSYGVLTVFARDGRRADKLPDDGHFCGNECDAAALEWLLKQPGPRYCVTDGGFCGGLQGQEARAVSIVAVANERGSIKFIPSYEEFERDVAAGLIG